MPLSLEQRAKSFIRSHSPLLGYSFEQLLDLKEALETQNHQLQKLVKAKEAELATMKAVSKQKIELLEEAVREQIERVNEHKRM